MILFKNKITKCNSSLIEGSKQSHVDVVFHR